MITVDTGMAVDGTTMLITKGEYQTLIEVSVRNKVLREYLKANEFWDEPEVFRILGDNEAAKKRAEEIAVRIKKHS